jgi:hypothetical protein
MLYRDRGVRHNHLREKVWMKLTMVGRLHMAGNSIGIIRAFYLLGVRYVSLVLGLIALVRYITERCSVRLPIFATMHSPTRQLPRLVPCMVDYLLLAVQQ